MSEMSSRAGLCIHGRLEQQLGAGEGGYSSTSQQLSLRQQIFGQRICFSIGFKITFL